jgi:hypothetical protein
MYVLIIPLTFCATPTLLFLNCYFLLLFSDSLLQAKAPADDHAIRAAVEATDAAVLRAIAAQAAGSNPILSPPPPNAAVTTPGMDWLERMKAEDAALQRAVQQNDMLLRK